MFGVQLVHDLERAVRNDGGDVAVVKVVAVLSNERVFVAGTKKIVHDKT